MSNPNEETAVIGRLEDRFEKAKVVIDRRLARLPLCFCPAKESERLWSVWVDMGGSFSDLCDRRRLVINLRIERLPLCFCREEALRMLWKNWITETVLEG